MNSNAVNAKAINPNAALSIGQLADATGVSVSAIRYYERRNLVTPIGRVGDKRRFAPEAAARLLFVTRARQAGFTLDQIRILLDDSAGESHDVLIGRLADLKETRVELDRTIAFLEEAAKCGCAGMVLCERTVGA